LDEEYRLKSQEAIERIDAGVTRFQTEVFPSQRAMFEALARGQHPIALFITCADSRIVPNLITQTGPGELFVERNPGNLVPRHEEFVGGVSASVEYAMLVLHVPLVIICGHTDCGVMKGLLHPEKVEHLPAVFQWMRHANGARERLLSEAAGRSEEERLNRLTQYNVLLQIENLKTHPSVRSRLDAGDVEIRGWVYDIAAGSGWTVNPESGKFEEIPATRRSKARRP
jgi:carbonic anhydrase